MVTIGVNRLIFRQGDESSEAGPVPPCRAACPGQDVTEEQLVGGWRWKRASRCSPCKTAQRVNQLLSDVRYTRTRVTHAGLIWKHFVSFVRRLSGDS